MTETGWRTVIIDSKSNIGTKDECLTIEGEGDLKEIPLLYIQTVLINNRQVNISAGTLAELSQRSIKVIICNKKHNPECETVSYTSNHFSASRIMKQSNWSDETKASVWQMIVKDKIMNQASLIKTVDAKAYEKMMGIYIGVEPDDKTNREAQAARLYFNILFGKSFRRRTESKINSALNYGYAVLLSCINRTVTLYGYSTALGIKHKSCDNPFNLSCDLIETFRYVIDAYVYANKERELDFDYKQELIALLYSEINYFGRKTSLMTAVDDYTQKILKMMSANKSVIKEKQDA